MDDRSQQDSFMSLTHIGWDWDVSNRTLGKELERAGYRIVGTPTRRALDEGLAIRRKGGSYAWSRQRVGEFILRCGCSERDEPIPNRMVLTVPVFVE